MPVSNDLDAYYAFDAGAGSGIPAEDQWEAFAKHITLSGVLLGEPFGTTPNTTEFQVYGDSSGRQVKVRIGRCLMAGHPGWITTEKTLAIDTADATNPRIDRVVLRLNRTDNKIYLATLTGTPAVTPVPPALTVSATIEEILLADVAVAAGATTIASGDVTVKRRTAIPDARGWPTAQLGRTADQTGIASAVETTITWQQVLDQSGGFWWSNAQPTRMYAPRPGRYRFHLGVKWDNAAGGRTISLLKNGSARFGNSTMSSDAASIEMEQEVTGYVTLGDGDYVTATVFHASGANRSLVFTGFQPVLDGELVRPS